jgi:hypothetical protein
MSSDSITIVVSASLPGVHAAESYRRHVGELGRDFTTAAQPNAASRARQLLQGVGYYYFSILPPFPW